MGHGQDGPAHSGFACGAWSTRERGVPVRGGPEPLALCLERGQGAEVIRAAWPRVSAVADEGVARCRGERVVLCQKTPVIPLKSDRPVVVLT